MTLIETMLVLSIIGLMSAIVAPTFGHMRVRWQVEAAGQQLVRDLARARTEAIKRNETVWLAKTGSTTYDIRYIGARDLPGTVTFASGPDTVKFVAPGPAITGHASFKLAYMGASRDVKVHASGFATVE